LSLAIDFALYIIFIKRREVIHMKYIILCVGIITAVIALTPQPLKAPPVFVHGYVFTCDSVAGDTIPVDSAQVDGICLDKAVEFHTSTNSRGYYRIERQPGLPQGTYRMTASHYQYGTDTSMEDLPQQDHVNFFLR
jgi:glycine/D-amino acid oxidase-like deaminating enzyme